MYYTYVLSSKVNEFFYVGITADVLKKLSEHNRGSTKSTKVYVPWELFFFEEYASRIEARKREVYLKSGVGKEYIKDKWFRSGSSAG